MPMTRRSFVKLTAAAPIVATMPALGDQLAADDSLGENVAAQERLVRSLKP